MFIYFPVSNGINKIVRLATVSDRPKHESRKILKEKHLAATSNEAVAKVKARRQRMEERQTLYDKTFSLPEVKKDGEGMTWQLVIDFDPETKDLLEEGDKKLVKRLKPNQANGVKFMWEELSWHTFLDHK